MHARGPGGPGLQAGDQVPHALRGLLQPLPGLVQRAARLSRGASAAGGAGLGVVVMGLGVLDDGADNVRVVRQLALDDLVFR